MNAQDSPATVSRVTRSKTDARTNYNRLSRWYDMLAGSSEKKYRDLGLKALDAGPGEKILEIGYGTGSCILDLARSVGEDGYVYGIDISEGMYQVAIERVKQAGFSQQVDLQVGDAADLPYQDNQFDAVFMSFTLELFDNPEIPIVLAGCRRVLRTGGRLALVTMVKSQPPNLPEKIYEWFHARMPVTVDCRPILARTALKQAGFSLSTVSTLKMWGLPVEIILVVNP